MQWYSASRVRLRLSINIDENVVILFLFFNTMVGDAGCLYLVNALKYGCSIQLELSERTGPADADLAAMETTVNYRLR